MRPSPHVPNSRSTRSWFGRSPRRHAWRLYAIAAVVLIGGPSIALGVPDRVRIPAVKTHEAGDPTDTALFSHWGHNQYTCVSCHPSTFPQRKLGFTHADMNEGRYCGSCHDGRTAFGPKDKGVECETCHVPTTRREIDEDDLWK